MDADIVNRNRRQLKKIGADHVGSELSTDLKHQLLLKGTT